PRTRERRTMPLPLAEARRYADKAIEIAAARSLRVGVVVVDELGLLVQMDKMDGAPLMAADVAEAKALTALNFQRPTSEVAREYAVADCRILRRAAVYPVRAPRGRQPGSGAACRAAQWPDATIPLLRARTSGLGHSSSSQAGSGSPGSETSRSRSSSSRPF